MKKPPVYIDKKLLEQIQIQYNKKSSVMKICLGIFLFFSWFLHAGLVEKTVARVGEKALFWSDLKNYQKQIKNGFFFQNSLLFDFFPKIQADEKPKPSVRADGGSKHD